MVLSKVSGVMLSPSVGHMLGAIRVQINSKS